MYRSLHNLVIETNISQTNNFSKLLNFSKNWTIIGFQPLKRFEKDYRWDIKIWVERKKAQNRLRLTWSPSRDVVSFSLCFCGCHIVFLVPSSIFWHAQPEFLAAWGNLEGNESPIFDNLDSKYKFLTKWFLLEKFLQ